MKPQDQTFAEINLKNILHNIEEFRKLLGKHVKFMAVVKADAYGHGSVEVSKAISRKVDYLAVATISEALELRAERIKTPILLLSEAHPDHAGDIIKNGLTQTVYTLTLARALSKAAGKLGKKAVIHIKIDTGMSRIGASTKEAMDLFNEIFELPNIKIEGVFTHLAKAEEKNGFTRIQLDRFRSFYSKIKAKGLLLHAANSAGTLYHKDSHLDMVRVGLSLYGLYPPGGEKGIIDLKPALEFKTRVVYLKIVAAGTPVSYGSTYVTDKGTKIVTLPVGYADGLPRALSNKGSVLINGDRFPIAGRVCMDLTMADVGDSNVKIGDEVVLIGKQCRDAISADDVARLADTISYEIICGIGKRVPRIYKK